MTQQAQQAQSLQHLPRIVSSTIPHGQQVYDTAGNYGECLDGNYWWMEISELPDWRHEALIFLHEFVEMCLTKNNGVPWPEIDKFDTTGEGATSDDPGSLPTAPYHKEHNKAEYLERQFAQMLGVNFHDYNKALDSLEYGDIQP